jgi:hypothetical protein
MRPFLSTLEENVTGHKRFRDEGGQGRDEMAAENLGDICVATSSRKTLDCPRSVWTAVAERSADTALEST